MTYIVSENYLCFFSLIEMIMCDIGYTQYSQYSLANEFGVVLPSDYFIEGVNNYDIDDCECMQGAHVSVADIDFFLKKENIPLNVRYIQSNPYANYPIHDWNWREIYCISTFSYGSLYVNDGRYEVGHACLILGIDDDKAKIYDPGPRGAGSRTVELSRLFDAMYDAGGGLYLFQKERKDEQRMGSSKGIS